MIRRPPRSTLFPLHDALPIFAATEDASAVLATLRKNPDLGEQVLRAAPTVLEDPQLWRGASATEVRALARRREDRKSTRLNSSHANISYAVFCLKKKPIKSIS